MYLDRSTALRQTQSLTVSNNLIQSLKILQFRHDELSAFLEDQAERNPLIELLRPSVPASPAPQRAAPGLDGPRGGPVSDATDVIEATITAEPTLRDHLHEQISLAFRDAGDRHIAVELVDNIDSDGYLRADLDLMADMLGIDMDRLEDVLSVIHGFDPVGVGARDLAECLRLQLAARNLLTPQMTRLLDHIELLARFDLAALARLTRSSEDAVIRMARVIRTLDPKPGHRFDSEPLLPALPDVIVECRPKQTMRIELNNALLPRVLVDRQYYSEIRSQSRTEQDRRFVVDCMNRASFLVRCLDQRAQTLLTVATEIASRQDAFLRQGAVHLRPLSMKDVAEATGFHESTVCRAIANKFMMTPHGVFEMKYFFSVSIAATHGGADHSAETVRHRIRQLVADETADAVLSDDQIVAALKDSGIDLARRTVAKYRDMLRIPSSLQRRREKRAQFEYDCA